MVNLEWYRSFVQVYRLGTVSKAAQVLNITQPTVSQHLASLESVFKNQLFVRTPRQMIPTAEGKRLYTQVAAAIEQLEAITWQRKTPSSRQPIRLGSPQEFFTAKVLPKLATEDGFMYKIEFGVAGEAIEKLLAGKLDAAIATKKLESPDLEYHLIFEENFWLVAPPGTNIPIIPEILQEDLTPLETWLCHQPWIAYDEEMPIIRRFWRQVFGRRIDANPRFIIPNLMVIRQAIAFGLGFSVLPAYLCENFVAKGELSLILQPHQSVNNCLWLAFRKSARNDELNQQLLNLLQSPPANLS